VIDRSARDKLITELQWILGGEAALDSLASDPMETEDESVMTVSEAILQNRTRLPLSRSDNASAPSPQGRADIERAILFLRTDFTISTPALRWWDRVVLVCLAVFLLGVATELIAQDRLIPAVAFPVHIITLIAGGLFLFRLLISYSVQLAVAANQIIQVRLRSRTLSDLDAKSLWPFASLEELNKAKSLTLTASSPS